MQLPLRADVVVVGAGITGVSLAYWLTRAGADVIVLERSRLAAGASGRNADSCWRGWRRATSRRWPRTDGGLAAEVWALTLENHDRLAELLAAAPPPSRWFLDPGGLP